MLNEPQPRLASTKGRQGLARDQRLRRPRLFRETYDQGRRWVGSTMVLWVRCGEGASLRLGVVTSRKVGCAVERNLARRRLREAYRRLRPRLSGACDVVLIGRRAIVHGDQHRVEAELQRLAMRAGLLEGER